MTLELSDGTVVTVELTDDQADAVAEYVEAMADVSVDFKA
jgi:hypothetical protein